MTQTDIIEMAKQAGAAKFYPEAQSVKEDNYLVGQKFLERFAKLVAAKAFPDGVDAEWIARRTKYAVEQERANNALLCYQQRKHWDALACSDAIRAGTRARGEA